MSFEFTSVGKVCEVIAGQSPKSVFYNKEGKGLPFYQGKKEFGVRHIKPPTVWTTQSSKVAQDGDILMSVRAPVGPVNICTGEICIGRGLAAIRGKSNINRDYLFYFLQNIENKLIGSSGAVFNSINKSQISSIKIPLPPITTQEKIVDKLDSIFTEIDKAMAATEVNVKNAEALFQSYLTEVFENGVRRWETLTLGDVCTIVNGGTPKSNISEYWDGELNWITPKEMGKLTSREVSTTERKITEKGLKNSSAKLLPINSVILSSRAPIGHLAINKDLMATNQGCKGLVPSEKIHFEYLYYFLKYSKNILNEMGTGATFKELSGSKLAAVKITLPPVLTQKNLVTKLDAIYKENVNVIAAREDKLNQFHIFKQSILQQAFSGELVRE